MLLEQFARRSTLRALSPRWVFLGHACCDYHLAFRRAPAGVKHALLRRERQTGGGAFNWAINTRLLEPGLPLTLLAPLGADDDGRFVSRTAGRQRIDLAWPALADAATSASFILTDADAGESSIFVEEGARGRLFPADLLEAEMHRASACCCVSMARNDVLGHALQIAADNDVPAFVGLGRSQLAADYVAVRRLLDPGVEMVVCNRTEAQQLTKKDRVADQLDALLFDGRVRLAVITEGERGIHALLDGSAPIHEPAFVDHRPVVDDTGAGDAASSTLVVALMNGLPVDIALKAATRQGYAAVTAVGATTGLHHAAELWPALEAIPAVAG